MNNLTNRDIDLLLQALNALESSDSKNSVIAVMLGAMVARSEEERATIMEQHEQKEAAEKLLRERRVEELILLKAKLIQLRPREDA